MQQNDIKNKFNCEYATFATIEQDMAIEFAVQGVNNLYLKPKNSRLHIQAKITKPDKTNFYANTENPFNMTLHSIYRKIGLKLNGRNVGYTTQLNPYRSHLKTLLNFWTKIKYSSFVIGRNEGYNRAHECHHSAKNKSYLNARAATFTRNNVVELISRPHLDVFN